MARDIKRDMKHIIKTLILVVALMTFATGKIWAADQTTVNGIKVIVDINPSKTAGTVSVSAGDNSGEVKLTVTPASGYKTQKSMITVEKMADPASARSPRRESIMENRLEVSGPEDEIANPNSGTYTFTVPNGYGAYVTVTFYQTDVTPITSLSSIGSTGNYQLVCDVYASGFSTIESFSGTLEAAINPATNMPYRIIGLTTPLFTTLTGTVKNLVLEDVDISGHSGYTGAIACTANSSARIYNIGILSGSVGGTTYTGGLVGFLNGTAHVVNCYSFAEITGGTNVGGIVGYNNVESKQSNINTTTHVLEATMVMNCMFYGDITGGSTVSPVYGGKTIDNKNSGGLTTFNYYAFDKLKSKTIADANYKCVLAVEDRFLNRFEIYRQLLNSNKKLAAIYASTPTTTVSPGEMAKWVLETADKSNSRPFPYPVLKAQGRYPSIINYDVENAPDLTQNLVDGKPSEEDRNKGGKLGTLSVTILDKKTYGVLDWPDDATVETKILTLTRTDKDFNHFNYNYDKIQLPYYNDVGTGNYTDNKVVTGWMITAVTGGTAGTYSATDAFGGYNFADRECTQKDVYSVSGRVFSQGAYYDVPYGVTGITIEPYWGQAAYVSDQYYDVVYKENGDNNLSGQDVTSLGTQNTNNTNIDINGSSQTVYTSIESARASMSIPTSGKTVYDYAVVLVGNVHQAGPLYGDTNTPYTIMSVDFDKDNEPDYSFIFSHYNRQNISSIRFDFLNVPGTSQAQKPNGGDRMFNVSIFNPKGWFEVTNTCLVYIVQFEADNSGKTAAPVIFLGGVVDQFSSTKDTNISADNYNRRTSYIHVGSNAWFKAFGNGTHSDGWYFTYHVPVSVTGGDFEGFYLSGVYRPDAQIAEDDAEAYISGGRFKEMAGASQQMIAGSVHWQIYEADITNFYGGGINADKPIIGDITVDIINSHVGTYCGGPKFGDMQKKDTEFSTKYSKNKAGTSTGTWKKTIAKDGIVTTNATGCTFGKFFGAGYGGASSFKLKYYDNTGPNFSNLQNNYTNDRGKYFDGNSASYASSYGNKGPGVATDFDYEFFVWSSGKVGARFYVNYTTLSLAKTNAVNSNLTNCIINENFYGGGNLGKVDGTATSVLDGCTVYGNVFGGGFSASKEPVPIRNSGFKSGKLPAFNKYSGIFNMGEKSDATDFEWKTGTYTVNSSAIDETDGKHDVTTDQSLTTLGQVNSTDLTIKGNTYVQGLGETGGVFGGGDASAVNGNAIVKIEGTSTEGDKVGVKNVYGGGNVANVSGAATVNLQGNTLVRGNVFGGGNQGIVSGNTKVNIGEPQTTSGSGGDTGGESGSGSGGGDSNP